MVMMVSCKASLNKAAYQAAELPGNISGSPKVRAELIAKWRLLSLWSLRTDGVQRVFTSTAMATLVLAKLREPLISAKPQRCLSADRMSCKTSGDKVIPDCRASAGGGDQRVNDSICIHCQETALVSDIWERGNTRQADSSAL
ncbi:hypothetical protein NQZ68_027492 [Dissostichus eleginoides]|nr:hypothetical protein NQZ68_027492 [Dissostichus eleginoides]